MNYIPSFFFSSRFGAHFRSLGFLALTLAGLILTSCDFKSQAKKRAGLDTNPTAAVKKTQITVKKPADTTSTQPIAIKDSAVAEKNIVKEITNIAPATSVAGPDTLPGSILPGSRIVAFYGNPLSKRMGILGELPTTQMLEKLDEEVARWQKADPTIPVQPALHLVAITAQSEPGKGGKYRLRMTRHVIDTVLAQAKKRNALVFLDLQIGRSTLQEELPLLEEYFKLPHIHLGIDAEFSMKGEHVPGRRVGTYDAADINYASQFLANIARQNQLPPKLLIVHRFTQRMITNYKNIELDPYCQIVMHMDGWGSPSLKRGTYNRYIKQEPVQYTGFKVFYKNDTKKKGSRLMKPEEILALNPKPYYIQYQ